MMNGLNAIDIVANTNVFIRAVLIVVAIHSGNRDGGDPKFIDERRDRDAAA